MTKLIEKEINQMVEDSAIKSPTEFNVDPSLEETQRQH